VYALLLLYYRIGDNKVHTVKEEEVVSPFSLSFTDDYNLQTDTYIKLPFDQFYFYKKPM
jgi:hypothetical protein